MVRRDHLRFVALPRPAPAEEQRVIRSYAPCAAVAGAGAPRAGDEGSVSIGRRSSVQDGATVRATKAGDVRIGANVSIGALRVMCRPGASPALALTLAPRRRAQRGAERVQRR